ncbi:MAG TPA: helix-turn-helix transcriptional regulator [Acidimicrobiales bacterium]|nr:helix-turn-helix transcriptional regulator [Acidimicrobiales bacterium]
MINRDELATFLRSRRARLRPPDVGLPDGPRRRTPGLRRQEVAELAGMSVDYYVRLEQARGPRPSRQLLGALGRALMLTGDERAYLFHLAGEAAPASGGPTREVRVALRSLLATMNDIPAYVMDAKYDVLAWNHLATFFIGDLEQVPAEDRNVLRWMFTAPRDDTYWDDKDALAFARSSVADLRAAAARYPGDRGIHDLVTEMLGTSPRFAALWAEHEVAVRRSVRKTISHPAVGPIEIDCQVLHIPDTDQRLVVYVAAPGSPGTEALRTLRELAPPRPQSSVRG